MSAKLIQNTDGADFQAQAVLAYVRYIMGGGIESSWNDETKRYDAEPKVCRFDNGREQGYVIFLLTKDYSKQVNVTFYEHRNSDTIYIQVNNERTFNAPQLDDIIKTCPDKWTCAARFEPGKAYDAAMFVVETLTDFWDANTD